MDELISDVLLWTPSHWQAKVGRPAQTYIQQLCATTRCSPVDLPEAMDDRKGGKRGSEISVLIGRHDDDNVISIFFSVAETVFSDCWFIAFKAPYIILITVKCSAYQTLILLDFPLFKTPLKLFFWFLCKLSSFF